MDGNETKVCSMCWMPNCKLCADDSTSSCKMCEKGYALQGPDDMKMCVKRCEKGTYREKMTMDKSMVPDFIKNLDYAVCKNCSDSCSKCKDKADFCLQCKADGEFAQPDGTCDTTCPAGTYPRDGKCKNCGPNIATCGINDTTGEFEAKTCKDGFFVGKLGKA